MSSSFLDAFLHAGSFNMHGAALGETSHASDTRKRRTSEVGIDLGRSWLAGPISLLSNDLKHRLSYELFVNSYCDSFITFTLKVLITSFSQVHSCSHNIPPPTPLPALQVELLAVLPAIASPTMSKLITPSTGLVKLRQAVLLRDPVGSTRAGAFGRYERVRADDIRTCILALHGILGVGSEVIPGAEGADAGCGEGTGSLRFAAADGLVGLRAHSNGCEGGEEEGED